MHVFLRLIFLMLFFSVIGITSDVQAQLARVDNKGEGSGAVPGYLQYKSYGNVVEDFSIPHRTQAEILDWTNRRVANLMTFDAFGMDMHFKKNKQFFIKSGWEEFIKYTKDTNLQNTITQRNYALNSIVDGHMFIKRQGVVSGVYRWLVEVPVLMSFYQQDIDRVLDKNMSASAQIDIVVTITRVADGGGAEQMAIAGWQVTERETNRSNK